MDKKVLFLDFDGVLNNSSTPCNDSLFDIGLVSLVNDIVRGCDCDIVISSSWRGDWDLDLIRDNLVAAGFLFRDRIIDCTPLFPLLNNRGDEIKRWIDWTGFRGRFAIVDDDDSGMVQFNGNFFLTWFSTGLTRGIADGVIRFLNEGRR